MKAESSCYSCFSLQGAFLMQLSVWEAWRVLSAFLQGRGNIWVVATQVHRLKQNYPPYNPRTTQEHGCVLHVRHEKLLLWALGKCWGSNTQAGVQNCVPRELNPNALLDEDVTIWHWFFIKSSLSLPSLASLWVRYATCFKIPVLILEERGNG